MKVSVHSIKSKVNLTAGKTKLTASFMDKKGNMLTGAMYVKLKIVN